jgi:hypothetical protein
MKALFMAAKEFLEHFQQADAVNEVHESSRLLGSLAVQRGCENGVGQAGTNQD